MPGPHYVFHFGGGLRKIRGVLEFEASTLGRLVRRPGDARLIEPERGALRVSPGEAARLVRMLLFSGSHPGIPEGRLLTLEEIVSVILDGVRAREHSGFKGRPSC